MLEKVGAFLQGKRTYVTVLAVAIVAVLNYQGITIPEYVWAILGAAGLGFLRAAVTKVK